MKHNYLSIRAALGALGAICCAVAIPSISLYLPSLMR